MYSIELYGIVLCCVVLCCVVLCCVVLCCVVLYCIYRTKFVHWLSLMIIKSFKWCSHAKKTSFRPVTKHPRPMLFSPSCFNELYDGFYPKSHLKIWDYELTYWCSQFNISRLFNIPPPVHCGGQSVQRTNSYQQILLVSNHFVIFRLGDECDSVEYTFFNVLKYFVVPFSRELMALCAC